MSEWNRVIRIAMEQSAIDNNCSAEDFCRGGNVIVRARLGVGARKYLREPFPCNLVSYGSNIVASVADEYREIITDYLGRFVYYHCFETPNLHWLEERLCKEGLSVCFMAEYFLPDPEKLPERSCGLETRILTPPDFAGLYLPEWSNALCAERKESDVLGVGAYEEGKLVGFAGCSADCETMWQIGVDVLPGYRRRGIASALTARLAKETFARGKVPFYCAAWSNLPSVRNALRSGFRPAWVEMTVKPKETVDRFNRG